MKILNMKILEYEGRLNCRGFFLWWSDCAGQEFLVLFRLLFKLNEFDSVYSTLYRYMEIVY